ncbi:hypothetical protein WMY93_003858 [Mugilogobius chulae]|uniref:C3H1-type domain-containing protein n=1 Tax=Mugilogobius chulae TaxID=88201 RepID=A0AAW0Q130_9GOBI
MDTPNPLRRGLFGGKIHSCVDWSLTLKQANMSGACQDRRSRWQEIQKGLQFIESTLPFPGSPDQYEVFIKDLVWNLFGEGNDVYKEGEWAKSIEMYTEALSVADYADSEDICVCTGLIEKLYANRAAAYLNITGLYDAALDDCEKALQLNDGNYKALFRKAKCLKELGRHQEAYEAVAKCSLVVPQDPSVMQLTQDLAKNLGLKIRKAYVRTKPALNVLRGSSYQDASSEKFCNGSSSVEEIEMEVPQLNPDSVLAPAPVPLHSPLIDGVLEDRPPSTSLSCGTPSDSKPPGFESVHRPVSNKSGSLLESNSDFDTDIIGDDLDDLLDQARPESDMGIPVVKGPLPLPTSISSSSSCPFLMPSNINPFLPTSTQTCTVTLPPLYHQSGSLFGLSSLSTFDTLAQPLDSLDSLSISDYKSEFAPRPFIPQMNNHEAPMGMPLGMPEVKGIPAAVDLAKNPLAETHEFRQACSVCYVKTGKFRCIGLYTSHREHKCKKDALLGRLKHSTDKTWKLIRPRPTKTQYVGPYYICKEVAVGQDCLYPGHCTFAYCQEEIDVWTLERKGFISRELLFDPFGPHSNVRVTVPKILQEHHGIFMFLCGVCFDHKPRIISKTNKDFPTLCSHPVTKHDFESHKCLVHILKENMVRYSKIRPLTPLCQLDLCRHEVRYGCSREDECFYAHSLIELKVWMMQRDLGLSHESIVQEAKKFWAANASLQGVQLPNTQPRFGPPNLKMMHTWAKDRRVVLVSSNERKKWTTVRPLPTKKPIPAQFEICMHVTAGKKCQYIGNCTFAHSVEERDLWTYMKENNIGDMEQLYEQWLLSQKPGWGDDFSNNSVRENGKQIHMPTDYAEEVAGNHCWLCGKNCNSEKQWQQHITSENTKIVFLTLRMIRTVGSIDFPLALLKFVKGSSKAHAQRTNCVNWLMGSRS